MRVSWVLITTHISLASSPRLMASAVLFRAQAAVAGQVRHTFCPSRLVVPCVVLCCVALPCIYDVLASTLPCMHDVRLVHAYDK